MHQSIKAYGDITAQDEEELIKMATPSLFLWISASEYNSWHYDNRAFLSALAPNFNENMLTSQLLLLTVN